MKAKLVAAAAVLVLLVGPGCGKKGPIHAPLVLVPQPVESLKAVQRGGQVILEWTNPESFIDGRPLGEIGAAEIWLEERPEAPSKETPGQPARDFSARGKRIALISLQPKAAASDQEKAAKSQAGKSKAAAEKPRPKKAPSRTPGGGLSFAYSLGSTGWTGKTFIFAVRVSDPKNKKYSDFSNEVSIKPQVLPGPPAGIQAEILADRVDIRWKAPDANFDSSKPPLAKGYNVYRLEPESAGAPIRVNAALLTGTEFSDRDFLFDRPYRYFVRASASDSEPYLESDDSPAVDVLPRDVFPPAVPSGLAALKSQDVITLVWDAGKDSDLAGYKVWRKTEGQPDFVCLTQPPIIENTYTDRAVEKNKRYEYAISAVDTRGNESAKSAPVSEIIKDPNP